MQAKVNPLVYFYAKEYNIQKKLQILQLPKISEDFGRAFTVPMLKLVNKYADVFKKPGKPVAQNIKQKNELLGPEKPIPHDIQQENSD